jgi:tRNA U54 and U55 pseudouridine synthase Pus10
MEEVKSQMEFDDTTFCKGCLFIFKNINLIISNKDFSESLINENLNSQIMNEHKKLCLFCLGILNLNNFESILDKISPQLNEFEHKDFKITTNFSPLFHIFQTYWKILFKRQKQFDNLDSLDITLIRKILKPFMIPYIEEKLIKKNKESELDYNMKSDLEIKIIFDLEEIFYDKIYEIFSFMPIVKKLGRKKFKPDSNMDRGAINELVKNCSSELFNELINKSSILKDIKPKDLKISIEIINSNLYLKGNYLKFSREIGQSPWEVNGVKICSSSVEDEIKKNLIEIFKCQDCVMSAGGREDRDVRMLGSGRPFIIDIVNPKIKSNPIKNLKEVESQINNTTSLIMVKNLEICDKSHYAVLKKYEDSKQKFYSCLVWTEKEISNEDIEKINSVRDLNIIQKTPMRVMHRRTLMDRKKTIYKLDAQKISDNFMVSTRIY